MSDKDGVYCEHESYDCTAETVILRSRATIFYEKEAFEYEHKTIVVSLSTFSPDGPTSAQRLHTFEDLLSLQLRSAGDLGG
jgi:hypothetical protein